ncbi:Transposase IS200 like [Neorhodopirellula lusitana]|uniref:Transposase IS200 like n=1 Tax=Neorhodopirellula lusitana TaxID=445327 RepID=A0ABY1QFK2_9BACT|nr:transposase [Neorhodopirellula lusitana]SMP69858.1 Transposase IS200 like [Neorhodopirellula lusitana]
MFELSDPAADFAVHESAHLPHWYQPGAACFITFRTADSIPADISRRWHASRVDWMQRHGIFLNQPNWKDRFAELPTHIRREYHDRFSKQFLDNLDRGWGNCVLKRGVLAKHVADALLHFDAQRYHLGDYIVMPNHVHLIASFIGDTELEKQCYSWKKFSARGINRELGVRGRFWQEESFDHLIRSPEQFAAIVRYIRCNPQHLKAGDFLLSPPK